MCPPVKKTIAHEIALTGRDPSFLPVFSISRTEIFGGTGGIGIWEEAGEPGAREKPDGELWEKEDMESGEKLSTSAVERERMPLPAPSSGSRHLPARQPT